MISGLAKASTIELINTLASVFTAIGTVAVSAIALWLTWKDRVIQVKGIFDYGLVAGNNPDVLNQEVYVLSFTNIGCRTAVATNYEWHIRKFPMFWRYIKCFTFPYMEPSLGHLCSKFPLELGSGKEGHIFHKYSLFADMEDKENFLYPSAKALAFYRIFTFKIVVKTTIRKDIKVDIPLRVRKHLWKRYKN